MKKQKKIWLPYDKSEIGAITTWLEEQAEQGWRLIRTDSHRMTFEESETKTLLYLIAPHTAEKSCLSLGWQRIDFLSNNFDIYVTDDSAVNEPKLNSSGVQLALYHQVVKHTYISIPCFLFSMLCVRLGYYIATSSGFIIAFVEFGSLLFLSLAVSSISGFICGIMHLRQAKIRSEHLSELAAPRRTPLFSWHPKRSTVLIYLMVFCSIFNVWQLHHVTVQKIPANRFISSITLPVLPPYTEKTLPLLEKVCPQEWAVIESAQSNSNRNYCLLTKKHSLFMKNGYELSQDGPDQRDVLYDINYYNFRTEFFATAYADEQSACIPAEWEDKFFSLKGFNTAVYYSGKWDQHLILRAGTVVITVHYRGMGDLWEARDLFAVQ